MFLKRYDLLDKFPISYQKVYLEQKCIILLNLVNNHYFQYCNELIYFSNFKMVCIFIIFVFSCFFVFFVLPSNFIVSGVKSSRLYPFLILNVILFSILFTYICTDGLSISSPCFLKYTQIILSI